MSVEKALNEVTSAGQARAAIGEALSALGRTYPLLSKLTSERAGVGRRALDLSRGELEAWYRDIKSMSHTAPYKETFSAKRKLITRAYVEIAGVEGEAHHQPQISNWEILTASIREAPGVFAEGAGAVLGAAGQATGSAAGGSSRGLGSPEP